MKNLASRKISAFFKNIVEEFENKKLYEKESGQYSGIVYTPNRIAEFIVKNIFKIYITDLCAKFDLNYNEFFLKGLDLEAFSSICEKNPEFKKELKERIEALKILDPACGSGRFLISAGNFILKFYKLLEPNVREFEIKKLIIQNILYGVELDKSAHMISKIRLLSWLFSSKYNFPTNIESKFKTIDNKKLDEILNDSQISFNIHNLDFLLEFNLNKKFDIIIGNPPYIENKKLRDTNFKKKLKKRFKSAYGLFDLSIVFLERSLELLNDNGGYLSFLMTNKFLAADYGIKIRKILLKNTEFKEIINISSLPVFAKAAIYPIIISFRKESSNKNNTFILRNYETLDNLIKSNYLDSKKVYQNIINILPSKVIPISGNIELLRFLYSNFKQISDEINDLKIIYRPFGFLQWKKFFDNIGESKNSENDLLLIGTGNVGKFHIKFDKRIRIAKNDIKISYFKYTHTFKDIWKEINNEKLIFREIAKDLTVVYDPGVFTNITGLYFIKIPSFNTNELFCLLSILNSKLMNSVFKTLFGTLHMSGAYLRFNGSFIKRLPMPGYYPESLSYLGKINQFLSQILYDQNNTSFKHQEVEHYLNFFSNLSDSLVSLLYLKELLDKPKLTNLLKFLTQPQEILPDIECKYSLSRFDLPQFKIYSKEELKLNLLSIENSYKSLNNKIMLINEIYELSEQDLFL